MTEFKVGDRVRVTDPPENNLLSYGSIHTVTSCGGKLLSLNDRHEGWLKSRFEKVEEPVDLYTLDKPFGVLPLDTKVALFKAFHEGASVEFSRQLYKGWVVITNPSWGSNLYYRLAKPLTKDTIDWSHVSPDYNYMVRGKTGLPHLFKVKPALGKHLWVNNSEYVGMCVDAFVSYKQGTCSWEDSLVERPST